MYVSGFPVSDFFEKICSFPFGNVYNIRRLMRAQKRGYLAEIPVKRSLDDRMLRAKFFARNNFAADQFVVQQEDQFGFHFVCSPCKQTAPSLIFRVPTTPLQRLYYTIFFCGFVQPRSRNVPRFRLNFPHFRLSRTEQTKKTGFSPAFFRFLHPFVNSAKG